MDLNRSNNNFFFFFFFLLFLVAPETTLADLLGVPYVRCLRNTTALSSSFTHNLNTALQNLTRSSSLGSKYASLSAGFGADNVYAIFQCRGDLTTALCSQCLAIATSRLPQIDCPASFAALIQLDGCYLRYGNESFLSPDFTFAASLCSFATTTDPLTLTAITDLILNVTAQAPKDGGFSSASADGEHAAAQCLGYLTESECSSCLSIASGYRRLNCNTSLGMQVHLTSCYSRVESFQFLETSSSPAPTAATPVAPAPAPTTAISVAPAPSLASANVLNTTHKGSKTSIIIASVIIAIVITLIACIILVQRYKANKITKLHTAHNESGKSMENGEGWSQLLLPTKAQVFSLEELEKATAYFHSSNKLGEGGYGPVYKGTLANGEQVAIKKLAIESHQGRQEFLHEVNIITSVQHKNLIRLLGSCVEGQERILVYEYFHNKSLDRILFGEQNDNRVLDWPTRYEIVLGMAKGLAYLHEESRVRIIHRDIKPGNILLDHQLKPVIGDFGLARLVQDDETHVYTRVAGTRGYLAPEYVLHGDLSEKVDVFSFGVVSLEILTGKRNLKGKLLKWAWRLYEERSILELADAKLGEDFNHEQVIRIAHIALLCTQEHPKQRPTMSTIALLLVGESNILELPQKPTFVTSSESNVDEDTTSSHLELNIF